MTWKPNYNIVRRRALARQVLAVLTDADDGWRCYIDAVPGQNHEDEQLEVAAHGMKQPETVASALFPDMKGPYRA